jgi:hypothetical protein
MLILSGWPTYQIVNEMFDETLKLNKVVNYVYGI